MKWNQELSKDEEEWAIIILCSIAHIILMSLWLMGAMV